MNFNRIDQVEKSVQEIEDNVKRDLQSAVFGNGKIKADQKTSLHFTLKPSWLPRDQS